MTSKGYKPGPDVLQGSWPDLGSCVSTSYKGEAEKAREKGQEPGGQGEVLCQSKVKGSA